MRVAAEITEGLFGSAKRPLRIDNPLLTKGLPYELRKDFGPSERLHRTVKPEFVVRESFLQRFGELAAKDFGQHVDWKEKFRWDGTQCVRSGDNPPAGTTQWMWGWCWSF